MSLRLRLKKTDDKSAALRAAAVIWIIHRHRDAKAALQWIAGMLVDNIARIVQNDRVRKPLPDKLPVAEFDTAAFIGHAFRQLRSIVRHAAKQQCCNQGHLGYSRAHHS